MNTLSSLLKNLRNRTPVGTVEMFAGASAPTDWLLCNGQAVSRATYSSLFALIGTTYGAGDGSTTFNVPDLRDKVAVGVSDTKALGSTGGASTHTHTTGDVTLTENQIPSHRHSVSAFNTGSMSANASHNHGAKVNGSTAKGGTSSRTAWAGGDFYTTSDNINTITIDSKNIDHTHNVGAHNTNNTGGGTAHNHGDTSTVSNYAPYTAINYIIYAGK